MQLRWHVFVPVHVYVSAVTWMHCWVIDKIVKHNFVFTNANYSNVILGLNIFILFT